MGNNQNDSSLGIENLNKEPPQSSWKDKKVVATDEIYNSYVMESWRTDISQYK